MNHSTTFTAEHDRIEEDILYEVSDEALETAGDEAMPRTAIATWFLIWCPA